MVELGSPSSCEHDASQDPVGPARFEPNTPCLQRMPNTTELRVGDRVLKEGKKEMKGRGSSGRDWGHPIAARSNITVSFYRGRGGSEAAFDHQQFHVYILFACFTTHVSSRFCADGCLGGGQPGLVVARGRVK